MKRNLLDELLLKIINHKDWSTELEVLELLKKKGAIIAEQDQAALLGKKEDVFKFAVDFFEKSFSEDKENMLFSFVYNNKVSLEILNRSSVVNNILHLVKTDKRYLYHVPENKTLHGQNYPSSLEVLIEINAVKAVKELISNDLIDKNYIKSNKDKIIKSLANNFLHVSYYDEGTEIIHFLLKAEILSKNDVFEGLLSRVGMSKNVYDGARFGMSDSTLNNNVECLSKDLFKLRKLGFKDLFESEDNQLILEKFNAKIAKMWSDLTDRRITSMKDLVQSSDIYLKSMKEYSFILDTASELNKRKKELGLSKYDFGFYEMERKITDTLDYLKKNGVKGRFSEDDIKKMEEVVKNGRIQMNKEKLEVVLENNTLNKENKANKPKI